MFIAGLITGAFIGGILGIVFTCCCVVAKKADNSKGIDEQ